MVATLGELTKTALVQILTEPKKALLKQTRSFSPWTAWNSRSAPRQGGHLAQATRASERPVHVACVHHGTQLIDTMFELPTLDGVVKVVLDEHTIEENTKPLLVYREQAKASA